LRMEVKCFGVHVSLIEPGDFSTGFTDSRQRISHPRTDAYREATARAMAAAESDERHGHKPEEIARLLLRVLRKGKPKLRYTVGPMSQRLAAAFKPFLPAGYVEREVMKHYNVL